MEEYIISVGKIEEWQMTNDIAELDTVFERAKRVLVGGGVVAERIQLFEEIKRGRRDGGLSDL